VKTGTLDTAKRIAHSHICDRAGSILGVLTSIRVVPALFKHITAKYVPKLALETLDVSFSFFSFSSFLLYHFPRPVYSSFLASPCVNRPKSGVDGICNHPSAHPFGTDDRME